MSVVHSPIGTLDSWLRSPGFRSKWGGGTIYKCQVNMSIKIPANKRVKSGCLMSKEMKDMKWMAPAQKQKNQKYCHGQNKAMLCYHQKNYVYYTLSGEPSFHCKRMSVYLKIDHSLLKALRMQKAHEKRLVSMREHVSGCEHVSRCEMYVEVER